MLAVGYTQLAAFNDRALPCCYEARRENEVGQKRDALNLDVILFFNIRACQGGSWTGRGFEQHSVFVGHKPTTVTWEARTQRLVSIKLCDIETNLSRLQRFIDVSSL